jgi:hypothetical protein
MSTYKITNITNLAGKREFKYNSVLDIDYVDEMMKKTISVKPGDVLYLTVPTLPLSVHRLRVKKLITVTEISPEELEKAMKTSQSKVKPEKKVLKEAEVEDIPPAKASKRKSKKEQ